VGLAVCLIAPVLLGYRSIHARYGFHRSEVEIVRYSADVAGVLSASPDSLLWEGCMPLAARSRNCFQA
jgi:hypothetical protein